VGSEMCIRDRILGDEALEVVKNGLCPSCQSSLTLPENADCTDVTELLIKCNSCGRKSLFEDQVEEDVERLFEYEIMKVGAKGGVFPLSICSACGKGTFNNYEKKCVYCGNTEPGDYDSDFEREVMQRNVELSMGI